MLLHPAIKCFKYIFFYLDSQELFCKFKIKVKKHMIKKKILFAVLNWGLGHATRSTPLIEALAENHHVTVVSTGKSLLLLKSEFPDLEFINLPDYDITYSNKGWMMPFVLFRQLPKLFSRLRKEHKRTEQIVKSKNIDLIISDCRYGVWSKRVPSFLLTHQLRIKLPGILSILDPLSDLGNWFFFRHFKKILVIDHAGDENLSGDLAHQGFISRNKCIRYMGLLADVTKNEDQQDVDVFITISGPEPQRSFFEKIILEQIPNLKGKIVVLLGKPGEFDHKTVNNAEIYTHLPRRKISELMNRAKVIVSRSGYSTVMELVALKKKAVLIPTPGQSEQEYLAAYFFKKELFYTTKQNNIDLVNDLPKALAFPAKGLELEVNDIPLFLREVLE